MKFLQIAVTLALLVVSTYALKCNVGTSGTGSTGTCVSTDLGAAADTCISCKISAGGQSAATAGGCLAASTCAAIKSACTGTYASCTTDNCNSCSPASALQVSFAFLLAAVAAMML